MKKSNIKQKNIGEKLNNYVDNRKLDLNDEQEIKMQENNEDSYCLEDDDLKEEYIIANNNK